MSKTIREPARDLPVISDVDICVLGGSATGVFAAVRAARLGAKVAIVERLNRFGGMATAALVNVWHSLYDEVHERKIIAGLTQETMERLGQRNAVQNIDKNPSHAFIFNSAELATELDQLVVESGIEPHLHTAFAAPLLEDGKLVGIAVENKSGRGAIRARVFVDATGDADLCDRLGLPTYRIDHLQPPTMCAHIAGWSALKGADYNAAIRARREEYRLEEGFSWGAQIPHTDVRMLAGTRVHGVDCSVAADLTRAEIEGRRQVRAIVDILNRDLANGGLATVALPSHIGVRETRHVRCAYQLTDDDVLYGRRFDDAIANGSYRVDVHHQDKPGVTFKYLNGGELYLRSDAPPVEGRWRPETAENPTFYQIPLRSLVPNGSENLIVAGRMLDVELEAYGAVRVMVNMNQTGEAAGTAAYHALDAGVPVERVDPAVVRKSLADGGSIII